MKLAGHPATEAKHMNNWLNRLERKYGRYGIPNLTNILVAGQILVLADRKSTRLNSSHRT